MTRWVLIPTTVLMEQDRDGEQPGRRGQARVRFAGDSDLTFINYGSERGIEFSYRQEARVHNAQRLSSQREGIMAAPVEIQRRQPLPQRQPLLNPLSTFARDPFHRTVTASPQVVERDWHIIFSQYFGLPHLNQTPPGFPNPSDIFLRTAKAHQDLYRSIVLQVVVTDKAEKGIENSGEAVFQNQAFILRDFRQLADIYAVPQSHLSSEQFQHVFASAFSFSGRNFNKEAGYNAIVSMNSLFMSVKQHQTTIQTPTSEWFRMLMPRPGPSFDRSQGFQCEMLRKVNLTLDFIDRTQGSLQVAYSDHILRYLLPSAAIYKIITTPLPDQILDEPYPGFYLICRHRVLSMLIRHFEHLGTDPSPRNQDIVQSIESLASICMQYSSPQSVSLFLWCLIWNAERTGLNQDQDEPLFSWAMKDLLFVHNLDFTEQMASWLLYKGRPINIESVPAIDIAELRIRMKQYYESV